MASLLRSLGFRNSNPLDNPSVPLTATTLLNWLGGPASDAGVSVTEVGSLGLPAVWRCVNLIAGTAASLPLKPYKADANGVPEALSTGQAAELLANPHPDMTAYEVWELVYVHMLLWGNAYLRVLYDRNSTVRELWPIHPGRVKAGRASDGTKVYTVDGDTENSLGDPWTKERPTGGRILHLPGLGYDGVVGTAPIKNNRQGIGLSMAAEKFGAKLFGSGSLMSGILTTEQRLAPGDADALKARWNAKMTGLDHAHEVAVLDSGAKFQQLTIPPEDAQFIETRKFQIAEIARIFGVPLHLLGDTEKSTTWGTGLIEQSQGFIDYTLRPWVTRVEKRVTKLLTPGPVFARYSFDELLRGDPGQRGLYYQSMFNCGAFSVNDIRAAEGYGPVAGGDVHYVPLNYGPLGSTQQLEVGADGQAAA